MSSRSAVRLLLLVLALVLTFVAFGSPSFTWGNEGVRIQHAWAQAVAAFGAALALFGAAFGCVRLAARVALGLAAAALVGLSAHHLAWRLEAIEAGVNQRSLRGAVSLRWNEIVAVEPRAGSVTLRSRGGKQLVIATSRFQADERVRLERTIARRVREAVLVQPQ
jgi:hypothetical protein